jgi:hypothetical protein
MVVNYILFNVFINFIVFHRLNTKNDINYPVKKNSLIHAFIASLGGSLYLTNLISFQTHTLVVYYSLGYIIYDIIIYTLYKEIKVERSITYFHHSLFLIGILYYYQEPKIYSTLILSEISTIPLNLRWLKKQEGNVKWTKIYSYLFYISFFVFRVVNCSRILYIITDLKKKCLISIFSGLNYYWFYLMTKKLIKSLSK